MRIAFFSEVFLPNCDGVVHTLRRLLEHLGKRGHRSMLFAPEGGPLRYAKTPVIGQPGYPFFLYPEIKLAPPTVDVSRQLERFRPDVVHLLNPVSLGVAGLWQAQRMGTPIVASYHTDVGGYAERYGMPFFKDAIWAFNRWVYNQADLTLCPSHQTRRELEERGIERVKLWTRGVDTTRFKPRKRVRSMRRRLCAGDPEKPLLLFVGRVCVEKRVNMLRELTDAMPEANLAIVGDGPARMKMEHLFAGTNTVFTGKLDGKELAQAYSAADAFVFPSANETFGNVVLEAMASGLPVVAAGSGGPLDFIRDGENGLLFEPEDPRAFVSETKRLFYDDRLRQRLGLAGRAYAETRSWDRTMDSLVDDYRRVAAQRLRLYESSAAAS